MNFELALALACLYWDEFDSISPNTQTVTVNSGSKN